MYRLLTKHFFFCVAPLSLSNAVEQVFAPSNIRKSQKGEDPDCPGQLGEGALEPHLLLQASCVPSPEGDEAALRRARLQTSEI